MLYLKNKAWIFFHFTLRHLNILNILISQPVFLNHQRCSKLTRSFICQSSLWVGQSEGVTAWAGWVPWLTVRDSMLWESKTQDNPFVFPLGDFYLPSICKDTLLHVSSSLLSCHPIWGKGSMGSGMGGFKSTPPHTHFLPGVDPWPHSSPVQFPVPVKRDSEYLLYIPSIEDTQEGAGPPVQPLEQTLWASLTTTRGAGLMQGGRWSGSVSTGTLCQH